MNLQTEAPHDSAWHPVTTIIAVIADRYAKTQAAKTGRAVRDFLLDAEDLLAAAGASAGQPRRAALADLETAEARGFLKIERHPRDPAILERVRITSECTDAIHRLLNRSTPAEERERLADLFKRAKIETVPARWTIGWHQFCDELAEASLAGRSIQPFSQGLLAETAELLSLLPSLLSWSGESYLRFVSCVLCGDSKRLEAWAPRAESALARITEGAIPTLSDLGIVANPRSVMLHGPLCLELRSGRIDLGLLDGVSRISASDIDQATHLTSSAMRCVSVENETMLHELAKRRSGELLIGTSFLGSGTRRLFDRLPPEIECWHFGDSDPAGFAILADLRERTGRKIQALHMSWRSTAKVVRLSAIEQKTAERLMTSSYLVAAEKDVLRNQLETSNKGAFEQETLGPPLLPNFPFYPFATMRQLR